MVGSPKPKDPDIDGGYAWAILTGCFMMYMCVVGTIKSYGVLYTEMVSYFKGGSGNTAWIGSVCMFLMMGLGPIANCMSQRFSFRKVAFTGGLLLGLGFITSSFVPQMEYMYLTFGVIAGLGYGFSFSPCSTIISYYFNKKRALANGVTVSASGIGALTLPFLYRYLLSEFGLRGTLLIIGGFLFNVCAAACIFVQPKVLQALKTARQAQIKAAKEGDRDTKHLMNGDIKDKTDVPDTGCCAGFNLKFSLFKNPRFVLYAFCFTVCMNGYGNNIILIPSHIKALGYEDYQVALSVSIMGGCEVVSRVFMGWLADEKVRPKTLFIVSMFVGGVFAFIVPSVNSYAFLAVYSGIIGIFPGSFWAFMPVMLIEVVGLEDFPAAFGLLTMCLAVGIVASQPAIGWIRDATGNWNISFYVTGCLFFCAALIILDKYITPTKPSDEEAQDEEDGPRKIIPLRAPSKLRLNTSMSENTDSLLDEDNDVSFSSHRISKIYRPYQPETPPASPKQTSAPLAAATDV